MIKRGSRWSVVLDLGVDDDGKRVRKWHSGFRTRKEAERARTELLSRIDTNSYVEPTRLTLASFLGDEWIPAIRASVRPSTLNSYESLIALHIRPAIGSVLLPKLTSARLNSLYSDLVESGRKDGHGGLSPKTVRNVHIVLRKALGDAVRWNLLTRNPAEYANPPKLNSGRGEMKTWAPAEVKRFLELMEEDRLYAAWLLGVTTGMRRGEILGLRWSDVDLKASSLSVRQTLISIDYRVEFSTPKTAKSRRSIALDGGVVSALRAHRKAQIEEKLLIGDRYIDNGLVFCRVDGSPLHPDLFSQMFDRAVKKSGLPRIRLHDLRHTHATLALRAGVHPKVVSERLGHASVAFTLDVYSHAIPAMQAEAAELVARLIAEQEP